MTHKDISARTALLAILLLWLLCAAVQLWAGWDAILTMGFNDPDDSLRLVEVRDWMAGQSWFDVSQYRIQPPGGTPMHWSRLVDLPIVALIRVAGLVLSPAAAEQVAIAILPLLILLLLAWVLYRLSLRLTGMRLMGVVAVGMLMLSLGILFQFKPNRVDHHDWQIVLAALTVLTALRALTDGVRPAIVAGLVAALSLTVAIEGLPLVVAVAGVFALRHVRAAGEARLLAGYLAGLVGGGAMLLLVMLGWHGAQVPWCDALSPAYLGPIAVALLLFGAAVRLLPQAGIAGRIGSLAVAGAGAALTFRLATPVCAAGPFASLDPLVARMWYMSVMEGRPVWIQSFELRFLLPLPSAIGLGAVLWAIRSDDAHRREAWIAMLLVQAATLLVSILVMRAMGLAHFLALPATAWMVTRLFLAARTLPRPVTRVCASAACFLLTPIGAEAVVAMVLPDNAERKAARDYVDPRAECTTRQTLRGLAALPRSTLFAPLDIGPDILVYTPHSVIGTGHHRARWGMKTVISAFIAPPDEARRIIAATPTRYLVLCEKPPEVQRYAQFYPNSLAAALLHHRIPAWLQPVPMRPGESMKVYRIER